MTDTLTGQEVQHDPGLFIVGCGCAACAGFQPASEDASADPLAGTTAANGKPIWTPDQVAAYLNRTGGGWGEGVRQAPSSGTTDVIRFGFFSSQAELFANGYVYSSGGRLFGLNEYFNFQAFNDAQKAAAREAMSFWDDLIAPSLVETGTIGQSDISFGTLRSAPTTQAYAYLPNDTISTNPGINAQIQKLGGDIWVSASQASNFQFAYGQYGIQTLTHEIGHALGLSHPGAYNAAPGLSITYGVNAEYYQDNRVYSIMSYFNPRDIGQRDFDWNTSSITYAATPLVHDIFAIQKMYGADMTTRTGDTVYGFNSTAGKAVFDFTINKAPMLAIWDAGGVDTLDASGYRTNQIIDLREGALSSIGGITPDQAPTLEQVNANRAAIGYAPITAATWAANLAALNANPSLGRLTDNVGIAYGAVIENGVGGAGNDTMTGNGVANSLKGMAGNDVISGLGGNDTVDGGTGADAMSGGSGDDLYLVDDAGDTTVELSGEGVDAVRASVNWTLADNVENLQLTDGARIGTGNDLANVLTGTSGGDFLYGLGGNDRLAGGDGLDQLWGGAGADTFVFGLESTRYETKRGLASVDVVWDFDAAQGDKLDLSGLGLKWGGNGAPKAGAVTVQSLGNVNAAENVLGFDLPGLEKGDKSNVSLVYADVDGDGRADIVIALVGVSGLTASDVVFG